jgi:cytochrome c biogenesis protein CcmG/thiol:disulfide interchange protein DsbE
MGRIKLFIPLLVFAVLAVFFIKGLGLDPRALPSALLEKPLPSFELPNLDAPGETLDNAAVQGTPALVNVWATWCPSCAVEHNFLNYLRQREGVTIIGVNYKDDTAKARVWLTEKGNPYRFNVVDADGRFGIDLGITGAPETYLIDARGIVQMRYQGPLDRNVWEQRFKPRYLELLMGGQ